MGQFKDPYFDKTMEQVAEDVRKKEIKTKQLTEFPPTPSDTLHRGKRTRTKFNKGGKVKGRDYGK